MLVARGSILLTVAGFVCGHALSAETQGGEGEDLIVELANEVLENKQEILPSPWDVVYNTPSDRDVGSVTEHPIAEQYEAEVCPCSLQTGRELEGRLPTLAIGRVLTKAGKAPTYPPASYRLTGVGGETVRHLNGMVNPTGATTVWGWQRSRYTVVKEWLDMWEQRHANKMVAIHASGEVLYAGCDENTMLHKFDQIVAASGNTQKVVVAAEVSPFPSDLGWRYAVAGPDIAATRTNVLSDFGAASNWETTYADCTNKTVGLCNSPPKYQFANPAFIMGTVPEVKAMLAEMSTWADSESRLVSDYFLNNPDKVALDYAGILAMSLHNMKLGADIPVSVETSLEGKKYFQNKVTNGKVCFVLGNGNSFAALQGLAKELLA